MNRTTANIIAIVLVVLGVLALTTGWKEVPVAAENVAAERSVSLGGAKDVTARIEMGVGRLRVSGGASDLMEARFEATPGLRGRVAYDVEGDTGRLGVRQSEPHVGPVFGRQRSEWDIELSDSVPIDLSVRTGAGEADLDLSTLDLTRLRLDGGVGSTVVTLGEPKGHDLEARIEHGVGELTVRVPKGVGVRIEKSEGVGDMRAVGFIDEGDHLVNEAYGQTKQRIDIELSRGVGSVRIEFAD